LSRLDFRLSVTTAATPAAFATKPTGDEWLDFMRLILPGSKFFALHNLSNNFHIMAAKNTT